MNFSTHKAIAALALVFLACGCATFHVAGFSSHNTWSRVTTPHFVVHTDLDERTAGKAAAELEATRDALLGATVPEATFGPLARTHVYVLATSGEYQAVFGPDLHGLFARGQWPAFYLHAPVDTWSSKSELLPNTPASVLRHEMAHQLIAGALGRAPLWLEEGLAQFLETAHIADDGRSLVLGGTNRRSRSHFLGSHGVTLRSTIEWKETTEDLSDSKRMGFSGTSYVFVHWLFTQRPEAFARYIRALSTRVDAKKAWDEAFAAFDPDVVGQTLVEYARGELPSVRRTFSPSAPTIEIRSLNGAEARVARAQILFAASRFAAGPLATQLEAEARREVKDARESAPTFIDALALDTSSPESERVPFARQAAVRTPQDPRVFALLGSLSPSFVEREQAYRHALELGSDDPRTLNDFALLLLSRDRPKEAVPIVQRALRFAPDDLDIIDTYADVLFRLGHCSEALRKQQRALHRSREADRRSAERMTRLYEQRKVSCAEPESTGTDAQRWGEEDWASAASSPQVSAPSASSAGPRPAELSTGAERPPEVLIAPARSGVSVGATVGIGYSSGSYDSTNDWDPSFGSLAGRALDVSIAAGYWVTPAFSLGLEGGYFYQVLSEPVVRPSRTINWDSHSVLRVGPVVSMYASPSRLSSFHVEAGIAYALGSMKADYIDLATGTPGVLTGETLSGSFLHGAIGYAWRALGASLGPGVRMYYGSLRSGATHASFGGWLVVGNIQF